LDVQAVAQAIVTNAKEAIGYKTVTAFLVLITVKPVLMTSHVSPANHTSIASTYKGHVIYLVRLIALYWDVLIIQVTVTNVLQAGMVHNVVSRAIFAEMDYVTFESAQTVVKIIITKALVVTTITVDHV
jgi:hypothetical protein